MAEYKAKLIKGLFTSAKKCLLRTGTNVEDVITWEEINVSNWSSVISNYKKVKFVIETTDQPYHEVVESEFFTSYFSNVIKSYIVGAWYASGTNFGLAFVQVSTSACSSTFLRQGTSATHTLTIFGSK